MKNNGDTLVILTPAFPKSESDSNWIPSHQLLVKALKSNFPHVHIVVLSLLYPEEASAYYWNGIEVVSFNGNRRRKWKRLLLWRDVWRELGRVRREHHMIGIFSFWCGEAALVGQYFGKRFSIPHRCWISGQDAQKGNKWVKFIRPRPEELVAMSTFLLNTFYKHYGVKPSYVIPNAIDTEAFPAEMPAERDIDVLAVGSLWPLKRYHLLIPVIASLRAEFPEVKARHFGDGAERERLQSLIRSSGLEAYLSLSGERPHREVLTIMQRSKILLHTSEYEGFSTVCLEALYAGAHVISFCDPIDKGSDRWHFVKSVEEMTAKAAELLRQPHAEYKPTLLYTMDDIAKSVMQLFYDTRAV